MSDMSSSYHNPDRRDVHTGTFVLVPCVVFPQGEPIYQLSKEISLEGNTSRLGNEGEIAMPLDITVPAERSMGLIHKPLHATSITTIAPFTIISPNEQIMHQNYFPQRQNYSQGQSLLASSGHHGGQIYKDLYVQGVPVLIEGSEFGCSVCNLRLPNHADLQQHHHMHTSELSSSSNIFNKNVTGKNELLQHIESRMGERSFPCTERENIFSKKSNLVRHQQMHTGDRPYKCDFCGHAFSRKDNLKTHQRKHTGERPFKCEFCGFGFAKPSALTRHRRTHTGECPFKCDICGYACNHSSNLTSHRRMHTGERPYKCKFCDYESAHSSNLKSHMRTWHRTHESSNIETSTDSPTS